MSCRSMINNSPPEKGRIIRIPIIIPIKGRGFNNQESGLGFRVRDDDGSN